MPKYKYKQKLKEYIARHGKPDALTEYFILQGFSEDEIKEGLEPYIEEWEEAIYWIGRDDGSEYDWDLWKRSSLYEVLRHATTEQIEPYRERIKKADEKFRSMTYEVKDSYGDLLDKNETINRDMHWWLFRIPIHGQVWRVCR